MSVLFDFLTTFNLLIVLICVIGLYWSINLVIDYYSPTSTGFVNMYFLYYIFFISTLLVAVGFSNYIEMDNSANIVNSIKNDKLSEILPLNPVEVEMTPLSTKNIIKSAG
jgi:hypothetical protein